ncbi:helix-turn-helix domain-containing protein [Mycobacterium marinum]|uniref:AlbA family DNA-binding domain-containing protein n=1 Tax=Mycobacterium marinum TaxID=1781 RepID=UPI0023588FD2|nr:ATP-binding protein [Mycobacterium marinum]MDC9004100.1 ATP-binding protein [Mycobacterium marinum]
MDDIRHAADNGLLVESHCLDLKRELDPPSPAANKNIAKDIAAFALDGGTMIIGVDEDTSPPSLHPIDLAGLAERVEQIAAMRVQEGVAISTVNIELPSEPGRGYLVVQIPASSRAPHMVDGRYYRRGDKTNEVMSHAEVLRHHERLASQKRSILVDARGELAELTKGNIISPPMMLLLAEPLGAREDLLVPLSESPYWERTVREILTTATVEEHQNFILSLAGPNEWLRVPDGVAAINREVARFLFRESGVLRITSHRVVESNAADQSRVVVEALILGHTDLMVRAAASVSERFGFMGSWRFGLIINGLHGAATSRPTQRPYAPRHEYTSETYERATTASLIEMTKSPHVVVRALVGSLLRSLGSHDQWPWVFDTSANP